MVATYIGAALYIVMYAGCTVYERYLLHRKAYFAPLREANPIADAVWVPARAMRCAHVTWKKRWRWVGQEV